MSATQEVTGCNRYGRFIPILLAALISLKAIPAEASIFLGGHLNAHKCELKTVIPPLPLIQQFGASLQQNGGAALPGDSENIRWADRFPGSNLGAQINAADADLGKEGGEIWVGRSGTVETRVNLSSNHVLRLLTPTTWKAGIVVQNDNSVVGNGCASLITLGFPSPTPLILGKGISDLRVENLCAEAPPQSIGNVLVDVFGSRLIKVTGCHTNNVRLGDFSSSSDIKVIGNTATSNRNDAPAGQAVNFTFVQGVLASDNIIRGFAHGFQWWGGDANPEKGQGAAGTPRGALNLTFVGNTISNVGGAGIWGSMGEGIVASANIIENCGDVCLDSEGSNSVVFSNNYVKDGANGAISTFFYNRDVLITGNTLVSSAASKPLLRTYTPWQKAPYDRDVQVVGNHFTCLDTSPCFISSTTGLPERFVFKDNTLRNVTLDISDANPKHVVVIAGNDFLFDVAASRVTGAIRVARTYSLLPGVPGYCDISNNTVRSNVPQPPGSAALFVYQDDPEIAPLTIIEANRLVGLHPFPIDIAVGGGSKNPAVKPLFLIRNNLMGAGSFTWLDRDNPRSIVKSEGNYGSDSTPFATGALSHQ